MKVHIFRDFLEIVLFFVVLGFIFDQNSDFGHFWGILLLCVLISYKIAVLLLWGILKALVQREERMEKKDG